MPSARRSSSACEEISIAHARSPPSNIAANVRWRSMASGVVRTTACSTPPITDVTVPSSPHRTPAASSSERTRNAVVVLPLVPVTPTTRSRAVGSPWKRAAATAMAERTSSTSTSGTPSPSGRWTTNAAAPRATASGAKSCPSRVKPGTQKNRVPGPTSRLSKVRPVTTTSGPSPSNSRSVMRPAVYECVRRELFDDGELIASYEYVERNDNRVLDRVTLHVAAARAAPVFAQEFQGHRVAGGPELGRALEALGAIPARHAHLYERGPSDVPPEI